MECAIHKLRHYMSSISRNSFFKRQINGLATTFNTLTEEQIDAAIVLWRYLLDGIIERIEVMCFKTK